MRCPICKQTVAFGAPFMPFCSERCKLIDLGKWADEEYRVPAEPSANAATKGDDEEIESGEISPQDP
jgi:uncharacterized protein